MTTDITGSIAARQRSRAARRTTRSAADGRVGPPRQRRPALAALALLLIVGGALVAGLLAVRMDSRVPVLVAARDIEPGAQITEEDLRVVHVASEGLDLLPEEYAEEVVGAYAAGAIPANTLLDERMVSTDTPIAEDRAVVSIPLDPTLTPAEKVRAGDLVQVVRAASASGGKAEELATAYVLAVTEPESDELGSQQLASASLLVPAAVVADVIDAASAGEGGLAILASGLEPDVPLEVAE